MSAPAPDPLACALIIVLAMSAAGLAHGLWMKSSWSRPLRIPIDGGLTWRGRRLLGEHKTVRGFVVLPPAAGAAFALLAMARDSAPSWLAAGLWPLPTGELFALGSWAGFWFMAGELPNSFYKRRRGIAPGTVPLAGAERLLCLLFDRIDSTAAMLIALSLAVPMAWQTALIVLALGPWVHLGFSAALYAAGVKARMA